MDERTDVGIFLERVADMECGDSGGQLLDERAQDIGMDEDPLHRHADLAGMVIAALHDRLDDPIEPGATVDDDRGGTAVFERAAGAGRGR